MIKTQDTIWKIPDLKLINDNISGYGKKGLLICLNEKDYNNETEVLLKRILSSVGLDLIEDAFLLKLSNRQKVSTAEMNFEIKNVLLFGLEPIDIGWNLQFTPNYLLSLEKCHVITCVSLMELDKDPNFKKLLWHNLQLVFRK